MCVKKCAVTASTGIALFVLFILSVLGQYEKGYERP